MHWIISVLSMFSYILKLFFFFVSLLRVTFTSCFVIVYFYHTDLYKGFAFLIIFYSTWVYIALRPREGDTSGCCPSRVLHHSLLLSLNPTQTLQKSPHSNILKGSLITLFESAMCFPTEPSSAWLFQSPMSPPLSSPNLLSSRSSTLRYAAYPCFCCTLLPFLRMSLPLFWPDSHSS